MKKIAVVGIGGIGGLLGFYLTRAGQDVTLICTSWRENAEVMKRDGLTLKDAVGEQTVRVNVLFIDELAQLGEKIEILFIALRSNDTEKILRFLKPYLAKDVWVVSLQNGMNEEAIIPIVGKENTIPCVSWTGGGMVKPGYVTTHEGYFIVGELDGKITPRVREIAGILSLAKRTEITENIFKERWNKLCQVTMTIPTGSIIGGGGGPGILRYEKFHTLLARVMCENLRVAAAAGYRFETMLGVKSDDWQKLARGPKPEVSRILIKGAAPPPNTTDVLTDDRIDRPIMADIISRDIAKGLPIEMYYLTGYIINKGKEKGVFTPVNELILSMIKALERGEIKPGMEHLEEILRKTAANY